MLEPATGETWGISGPSFLAVYALLAVGVAAWWWLARTQVRAGRVARPPAGLADRPQDVAYLNGGAPLAVFSALGALRLHGWVELSRGRVRAIGQFGAGASELERAIHRVTATQPLDRGALAAQTPVRAALDATEQRLRRAGLLLTEDDRARLRRIALGMGALAVLGVARLVAGLGAGHPVGFLILELIVVAAAAIALRVAIPRRTRLGDRALTELRTGRAGELDPRNKPDWALYGPAGAALGIGLFGVDALWASDPAMATELAAHRAGSAAAGSSGGGDGGGGGGGCGGGCGG